MSKVRLLGATLVSVAAALVLTSGAFATNHPGASVSNCSKSGFAVDPSCLLKQKAKNTANVNQTGNAQSGPATVNGGNATGGTVTSTGGSADGGIAEAAAPWIVVTKSTAKGGLATNLAPVQGGSSSSTASGGSQKANATGNGGTNSTGSGGTSTAGSGGSGSGSGGSSTGGSAPGGTSTGGTASPTSGSADGGTGGGNVTAAQTNAAITSGTARAVAEVRLPATAVAPPAAAEAAVARGVRRTPAQLAPQTANANGGPTTGTNTNTLGGNSGGAGGAGGTTSNGDNDGGIEPAEPDRCHWHRWCATGSLTAVVPRPAPVRTLVAQARAAPAVPPPTRRLAATKTAAATRVRRPKPTAVPMATRLLVRWVGYRRCML